MNRSIFWRLFWKEYRLQRALWIAMAVLTALLMLAVVALSAVGQATTAVLAAWGCPPSTSGLRGRRCSPASGKPGPTSFSGRCRLGPRRVFAAKIAFALLAAAYVRPDRGCWPYSWRPDLASAAGFSPLA